MSRIVSTPPNAARLLRGIQDIGYDNNQAIADITDNSIGAEATEIRLQIENLEDEGDLPKRIIISDNGCGMNLPILEEALKLGSDIEHETGDLGKFGLGLTMAYLNLGTILKVITKEENGDILVGINDLAIVEKENQFLSDIDIANEEDKILYNKIMSEFNRKTNSGTVIIISNLEKVTCKRTRDFTPRITEYLAQVFRKFVNIDFYVNNEKLLSIDPIYWDHPQTQHVTNGWEIIDIEKDGKHLGKVKFRIAYLPLRLFRGEDIFRKRNMANQGWSVLRNNREILRNDMLCWARHPNYNGFRGEMLYEGNLDDIFGIDVKKTKLNMVDWLSDKLKDKLGLYFADIGNRQKLESTHDTDNEVQKRTEEFQEALKPMISLLDIPKNLSSESITSNKKNDNSTTKIKKSNQPWNGKGLPRKLADKWCLRIDYKSMTEYGGVYQAHQEGKYTILTFNTDHVFYEKCIKDVGSTKPSLIIFAIFTSLALGQLKIETDDKTKILTSNWLESVSSNLRALLSNI